MKPVQKFECEQCHALHDAAHRAESCEKSHTKIKTDELILVRQIFQPADYNSNRGGYPSVLRIEVTNQYGEKKWLSYVYAGSGMKPV